MRSSRVVVFWGRWVVGSMEVIVCGFDVRSAFLALLMMAELVSVLIVMLSVA